MIALGFIIAIILIKYKPMYQVTISGEEVGYVQNKQELEGILKQAVTEDQTKNIDSIDLKTEPEYKLKLTNRNIESKEETLLEVAKEEAVVTYKYYEINLNNETIDSVDTIEEAEQLVNQVKEKNEKQEVDLAIVEKYTQKEEEVKTSEIEIAKNEIQDKVTEKLKAQEAKKEEQERIDNLPSISGVKLAIKPVSGTITSRYGENSRIRSSNHTGLDIATAAGTPIKAVAGGTIIHASYTGSYGNLVKIDHGNGIETWYAHTSKMYKKVGQKVEAGDVIAAVGSTGNSTGAHLHLEIRKNGVYINPQNYLY